MLKLATVQKFKAHVIQAIHGGVAGAIKEQYAGYTAYQVSSLEVLIQLNHSQKCSQLSL